MSDSLHTEASLLVRGWPPVSPLPLGGKFNRAGAVVQRRSPGPHITEISRCDKTIRKEPNILWNW
mgnify:CR=1 FL=1